MVVVYTAFADYFSKHRALAVGIVAAGSGLGGLVIPLLINYLFSTYAFREALICYGEISLYSFLSIHTSSGRKQKKGQSSRIWTTSAQWCQILFPQCFRWLRSFPLFERLSSLFTSWSWAAALDRGQRMEILRSSMAAASFHTRGHNGMQHINSRLLLA